MSDQPPALFERWAQVALWAALGACLWLVLGIVGLGLYALVEWLR